MRLFASQCRRSRARMDRVSRFHVVAALLAALVAQGSDENADGTCQALGCKQADGGILLDTTGDGKVDSVGYDKTHDGEIDTFVKYEAHAPNHEYLTLDGVAEDIKKNCPLVQSGAPWSQRLRRFVSAALGFLTQRIGTLQLAGLWPKGISRDNWADDFTALTYIVVARVTLGLYMTRDKSWVRVPTVRANSSEDDVIRVENVRAPRLDVDGSPNFLHGETFINPSILQSAYVPVVTCLNSAMRRLSTDNAHALNGTFHDVIDRKGENQWDVVLKQAGLSTPLSWVEKFYEKARTLDGHSVWPTRMTDFRGLYFKNDEYEDTLEYAMAFHLIAVHRVESGNWKFSLPGVDSASFPFRISTNSFSAFEVRPHFGKYGADLYFTADGMPALIITPDNVKIQRGDKKWQYWKFVWRSTVVTGITLVDHLHMTHMRAANILARSSREAWDPDFPLRRLTSIFTFGTIFVNLQAMHTLLGPNNLLHRATPFKEFTKISNVVPASDKGIMVDMIDIPGIKPLMDLKVFNSMPAILQNSPFFADGLLVMDAIRKLLKNIFDSSLNGIMCKNDNPSSEINENMVRMQHTYHQDIVEAEYALSKSYSWHLTTNISEFKCADAPRFKQILEDRFAVQFFMVTAWHRHVGFVGDYYLDPELATMSWVKDEKMGRPKQHVIMTFINVFTSTHQPLLNEDYSHLFDGMKPDLGNEFKAAWQTFRDDLKDVQAEVEKRNKKREIMNYNMHPSVLESSISK